MYSKPAPPEARVRELTRTTRAEAMARLLISKPMPTIRKVSPEQAAEWQIDPLSIAVSALARPPRDLSGLTRVNYPNRRRNSPGWMARVYHEGQTFLRFFSDGRYGGQRRALLHAAAWRDAARAQLGPRRDKPARRAIVRVDRPEWKNVGYFAWHEGKRRYFSDARYGGPEGAMAAAQAWAEQ
jgi:hypothetical protein